MRADPRVARRYYRRVGFENDHSQTLDERWEDKGLTTSIATAIMLWCLVAWGAWALLERRGGQNPVLYICASIFTICISGYLVNKRFFRAATLLIIFFCSRLLLSLIGSPDRFFAGTTATAACVFAYVVAMVYFDRKKNSRELPMMPALLVVSVMCLVIG